MPHSDNGPPPVPREMDPAPILPAGEIPGRYEEACEFARGGIGRILLVHDAHLDRDVALKELVGVDGAGLPLTGSSSPDATSRTMAARFVQEAQLTSQLQHPSIVPVHEIGRRADGTLYYTMKYVRGRTLRQAISEAASLKERLELLPHFLDLCHAIAYAHSRGVIHRDVKPANVMLGEFGETLVIDWGLAKVKGGRNGEAAAGAEGQESQARQPSPRAGAESQAGQSAPRGAESQAGQGAPRAGAGSQAGQGAPEADAELTQDGTWVGTPNYMAPEQARGDLDAVCEASDVYSLGVTLYHLLSGRCPFSGEREKVIAKVISGDYPPLRAIEPKVPAELVAICERAMRREPEARYETGGELAGEIQRFLSGALIESYHYTWSERFWRFVKRRKPLVLSVCVSVGLLLTVGVVSYVQVVQARDEERAQRIAAEEANRQLVWENYTATVGIAQERLRNDSHSTARELLYSCPPKHRQWEWGHLMRQSSPNLLSLYHPQAPGMPDGRLRRAVFSPDGRYVLDDRFRSGVKSVFDLQEGSTVHVTPAFPGWSECSQFTPDGRAIVVSTGPHSLRVIDFRTSATLLDLDCGSGWLRSVVIDPTCERIAGYHFSVDTTERQVILWEYGTGKELGRFPMAPYRQELHPRLGVLKPAHVTHAEGPLGAVLGFLDGNRFLVCVDEELFVLDTETGERGPCVRQCMTRSVAYASGPALAAVVESSDPYPVAIWDVRSRNRLASLEGPVLTETPIAISPDGRLVATAQENVWQLWSSHTGRLIATHDGHTEAINSIAFSGNGACVVTTSQAEAKIWPASTNRDKIVVPFKTPDGVEAAIPFAEAPPGEATPNGSRVCDYDPEVRHLAAATPDGDVTVWRVPTAHRAVSWHAHDEPIHALRYSPDGLRIVTGSADGTAKVWDAETGHVALSIDTTPKGEVLDLCYSPEGARLALGVGEALYAGVGQYEVRVVDARSGQIFYAIGQGDGPITRVAFDSDGTRLFVGLQQDDDQGFVRVLDGQSGTRVLADIRGLGIPRDIQLTRDPDRIVILSDDGHPVLWDLAKGSPAWRLEHVRVRHATMCECGRRLAVVSMANRLSIHAIEDGRQLITLGPGMEPVAFAPGTRSLTATLRDRHLKVFFTDDWHVPDRGAAFASGLRAAREQLGLSQ